MLALSLRLAPASLFLLLICTTAIAQDNWRLELNGYLSQAYYNINDGVSDYYYVGNFNNDDTTIRLDAISSKKNGVEMICAFEAVIKDISSDTVNQLGADTKNVLLIQNLEFIFVSDNYGILYIGQGDTASDNTAEVDITATVLALYPETYDVGASFFFRRADGTLDTNFVVADSFNDLDGLGKTKRIRYNSPNFSGFVFSTSYLTRTQYDFAVNFNNEFRYATIGAAIAFARTHTPVSRFSQKILDGSASILFDNGISITGSAARQTTNEPGIINPHTHYIKLGYEKDFFGQGKTGVAVDTGKYHHFVANYDKSTAYGAAIVQHISSLYSQVYIGWRQYHLTSQSAFYKNINTVYAGVKIGFRPGDIRYI